MSEQSPQVEQPQPAAADSVVQQPEPVSEVARQTESIEPLPLTWQAPIEKPAADVGRTQATPKPAATSSRLEVSELTSKEPTPDLSEQRQAAQIQQSAEQSIDETPAQPVHELAAMQTLESDQETQQTSADEEGLSLRFASPGDFLRLIARAQISVYAFNASGEVLGLNSAYDFMPARSPGQVYELLPQTIPSLVVDALARAPHSAGADDFSWGITLPQHIEKKISGYLASAASGELVIDRYGDVHHVVAN